MFTAVEKVFHSFYFFTSKAFGVGSLSGLKGFVLCPDGSVKDLEDRFFSFGGKQGQYEKFCMH
jgi:hypothetical protein